MKVAIVNTYDIQGGAARAANRLHNALLNSSIDSCMVVLAKQTTDANVYNIKSCPVGHDIDERYIIKELVQSHYIDSLRTELSNTLFSFAYPGYDISSNPNIKDVDIINLHWITFFQSPVTVQKLMGLGKPIVWTLHDMCPFTGGCHYSAGCDGYTRDCLDCPQLSQDPYSLPNTILKDKIQLFEKYPLTIVTPSRWLGDCARKSTLFRNCRIEVIPNCIETDIYTPMAKTNAKNALGIPANNVVLMFGAYSSNEKRKGFSELESALVKSRLNPSFDDLVERKAITILSVGPLTTDISKLGIDCKSLGHICDDSLISCAYSAADLFILPSLEDNLPNMMLEAMACGTPVLAFSTGGIPDVVIDGINGCLVPVGNVDALSENLIKLVNDKSLRESYGAESAAVVEKAYRPKAQAASYRSLFEDLLECSFHNALPVQYSPVRVSEDSILCLEYGPNFEKTRHKIMLDCLLKAIPDICKVKWFAPQNQCNDIVNNLENELYSVKQSLSWRITKPLRWLGDTVRGIVGHKQ